MGSIDNVKKDEPLEISPKLDLSDIIPITDAQPYKPEEQTDPNDSIKITDLFQPQELTIAGSGTYKTECPDCGLQGGRTEGFIIFPETNTAYCHTSHKWFRMLEVYALKKKIIRCLDGRDTGDKKKKVLEGELWTITLEEFKSDYGTDKYNELAKQLKIKKSVEIPGNNRTTIAFCDEMADIYKTRNILFRRAETGEIIRIDRNTSIKEDGEISIEKGLKKVESTPFVTLAEILIDPWTTIFTKAGTSMVVIKSMTLTHASLALESDSFKNKLPILHRVLDIQIPMMYRKSLTFPKKGYDKRFGTWLPSNAPQIKKDMYTLEQAKATIEYVFKEFCFETDRDKLHAIAAFLTPFCRGMFEDFSTRTPVFIYLANRERAGKDYCANCTGMLYEGMAIEQPPISTGERGVNSSEEIRKKLTACMMEGKKRFHSSNNKGELNNSAFESATTSKTWLDRVLGKTKTVTYNNEMDYSLSGNLGIILTPDLANRGRIIKLHLVDEDANARKFENPRLHEWILERRVFLISAMYTLVENWVKQGMKPGSVPFTSFPEWSRVVGGIMEAAGYDSPCKKRDDGLIALDKDTEEMKELFETCYTKYPNKWIDKSQIEVEAGPIMTSLDLTKRSDQVSFGLKIDKFVNRELSDILLKVDDINKRGSRRKYQFVKNSATLNEPLIKDKFDGNVNKLEKNLENVEEKLIKSGNLGKLGNLCTTAVSSYSVYKVIGKDSQTLPRLPDESGNVDSKVRIQIDKKKTGLEDKKIETSKDIDEVGKAYLRKELENARKPKNKEKTNRELQYYEDPQCAEIVAKCTKEQTLEWIKNNPNVSFEVMDAALGLGWSKWLVQLYDEKLIQKGSIGWEIVK